MGGEAFVSSGSGNERKCFEVGWSNCCKCQKVLSWGHGKRENVRQLILVCIPGGELGEEVEGREQGEGGREGTRGCCMLYPDLVPRAGKSGASPLLSTWDLGRLLTVLHCGRGETFPTQARAAAASICCTRYSAGSTSQDCTSHL